MYQVHLLSNLWNLENDSVQMNNIKLQFVNNLSGNILPFVSEAEYHFPIYLPI